MSKHFPTLDEIKPLLKTPVPAGSTLRMFGSWNPWIGIRSSSLDSFSHLVTINTAETAKTVAEKLDAALAARAVLEAERASKRQADRDEEERQKKLAEEAFQSLAKRTGVELRREEGHRWYVRRADFGPLYVALTWHYDGTIGVDVNHMKDYRLSTEQYSLEKLLVLLKSLK